MVEVQDAVGGCYSIEPTLRSYGFTHAWEERFGDDVRTPRQHAIELVPAKVKELVYHIWKHPRGYCQHINAFYKIN